MSNRHRLGVLTAASLFALSVSVGAATVPPSRRAWFANGGWIETPVIDRANLLNGCRTGPLIVEEYDATCLVPHGAMAALDAFGNISVDIKHADADLRGR